MSDKNKALYFVALIPPEPILSEVMKMKEEVWNRYGSKAALRSPAHITVHMPFQFRADREQHLMEFFSDFVHNQSSFSIEQKGFGCFEPRVIFVQVKKTLEMEEMRTKLVKSMRIQLNLDNADYKNQAFHPHMTIAFRDLKKPTFYEAWPEYETREVNFEWACKSICLLKHTGKYWLVHREFHFY